MGNNNSTNSRNDLNSNSIPNSNQNMDNVFYPTRSQQVKYSNNPDVTSVAIEEVLEAFQKKHVEQLSPYSRNVGDMGDLDNLDTKDNDFDLSELAYIEIVVNKNDTSMNNNKSKIEKINVDRNVINHFCTKNCMCVKPYNLKGGSGAKNKSSNSKSSSSSSSTSSSSTSSSSSSSSSTTSNRSSSSTTATSNKGVSSSSTSTDDFKESRIYLTDVNTTDLYKYGGATNLNAPYETEEIDHALDKLEHTRGITNGLNYDNSPSEEKNYLGLETPNEPPGSTSSEIEDLRTQTPNGYSSKRNKKSL
jgi:hypothetical protein